jgi:MFS family permease
MLTPYRKLFQVPGGWRFSFAAFILRLPISMLYLAIVLFVVAETDSYAIAGVLSMAASIVLSVASPLWSRAADQFGQRRILTITAPLHIFFMGAFVFLLKSDAPTLLWFTSALLFEAFVIGSGQMVRRRWIHAIGEDRSLTDTAYSFEAFVDEVIFTSGPVIATLLAVTFAPEFAIFAAMLFVATGALMFAGQRSTEPPPHPKEPSADHSLLIRLPFVRALFIPLMLCGSFFSSAGLVIVGYSEEYAIREWSGFFIAIWSLGSGISALVIGTIKWKRSEATRFLESLVLLFLLTIPIYLVAIAIPENLIIMGVALFFNGLAIAPLLTAGFAAAERSVTESRKTEVLAWAISALNLGGALPPAITGYIIDNQGVSVAFVIPLVCMTFSALSVLPFWKLWRLKVSEIPL